jgi:hypothetical protein
MKFARLFAAASILAAVLAAVTLGWQAGAVVYLACSMIAMGPTLSGTLGAQTFTSSEQFLQYMQANYGSANFSQWQSIRKQFYSLINYPAAGANVLNFFGYAQGGAAAQNQQYTNMPKAGSFGQQFLLLKSIQCVYYVSTAKNMLANPLTGGAAVDANNPAADFMHGLFQAGHFVLSIGAKPYVEIPKPFLYAPPADGETMNVSALGGIFNNVTTGRTYTAHADLNRDQQARYLVDPNILFEAEQQFQVTIDYPSGLIPIICSNLFTTNLFLGVILDGILFRPVQ